MEWIDVLVLLPTALGFYLGYWLKKRTDVIIQKKAYLHNIRNELGMWSREFDMFTDDEILNKLK